LSIIAVFPKAGVELIELTFLKMAVTLQRLEIAVGSSNPCKLDAVKRSFEDLFPSSELLVSGSVFALLKQVLVLSLVQFCGLCLSPLRFLHSASRFRFSVSSGVSNQPFGDDETRIGAVNRANNAKDAFTLANLRTPDFSIGLEGGVGPEGDGTKTQGPWQCFAWMAVVSGAGILSCSRTASFTLPPAITALMISEGLELGDADDKIFGRSNSKQEDGSVGLLTGGVITRSLYYRHSMALALIPFIPSNASLYLV
jgi:inosine/xanthosine triphosphatase